ncbi:hypothetical protein BDV38DRAFT_13355 [Aspergillus pseudotamarii]|uniref:Uncharacterized protein n=1 Tax=Aspergillus pseudotamarii TaxID=132259 RepID=A0A5N6SAW3_ASPPS|nr:uncharacterized protein BDV38DRAFT_13355 [Aspergillus pseudotamarii]KAE8131725.1 hypothetical protein BDV38DRAFT_13355 [Aspergillus pseudotamarii]
MDWGNWWIQVCHGRSPPSPLQVIAKDWSICLFDILCRTYSPSTTVCGNPLSLSVSMYLCGSNSSLSNPKRITIRFGRMACLIAGYLWFTFGVPWIEASQPISD